MTNTETTTRTNRYYFRVLAALALMASLLVMSAARPAHATGTLVVNSTADEPDADVSDGACKTSSGVCTLRAAIEQANATAGAETINFNIPGTGVKTIKPGSSLPAITEQVTIDGYSQPGASPNTLAKGTNAKPLIELDGTNSGAIGNEDGLTIEASNTVIKGLVINSFVDTDGVGIFPKSIGDVVTNVWIEGNFIGTDPSGTIDRGNGGDMELINASSNTVGGDSPATRNLISGNNKFEGIFIEGDSILGGSTNNKVEGNLIGTQKDGAHALGNGASGVAIFGDVATGNHILSNSIFSNEGLGIDLDDNGPTANDSGDADPGANNLQNFPDLASAKTSRKATTIEGTLNSTPNTTFTLQFFSNPSGTDAEGQKFIGKKSVSTDGSGNASFTFKTKKKVAKGANITATATDPDGNTSEFSAPKEAV